MCSKFSSSFLSKSPILAGEYGSGVDGMRYFSPKQPASKNPTVPKKQDKPVKDITGDVPEEKIIEEIKVLPSQKVIEEKRKLDRKEPGKKIIVETDNQKYLDSFKPGYARDPEGYSTIEKYREYKESLNNPKNFQQNQSRSITTDTDVEGVETVTTGEWGNVGDEFEITNKKG